MADQSRPEARETVSRLGREMLAQGLTLGTGGNVSVAVEDGVAISPSGMAYDEIRPADVPIVDLDGEVLAGTRDPSSETAMHTGVHRARPDVGGVVHTHSPYASTFASLGRPVPASHYLIAFVGDRIPVAGYATYGTQELADLALGALEDEYNACLLQNHGVLAVGADGRSALEVALMVEYCARVHYQAVSIGDPVIVSEEEVDRLQSKFADYGQSG
jgi:L-fuculose-phosphate aldolase